jgi:hypothetical protein
MCVPGKIEGLNLIVDLKGLSASQVSSNIEVLRKIYEVSSNHYSGRAFRFYVCNLSSWLGLVVSTVKSFLSDRQKQKIVMVSKMDDFLKDFAQHQLEVDYGGTRPTITKFLPFPLVTGPFEAGCSKGAKKDPVSRVHMVLTPNNCLGRLWDPRKTRDENIRVDFPIDAIEVLKKCNLPVPEYLADKERKYTVKKEAMLIMSQEVAPISADAVTNSSSFLASPQDGSTIAATSIADSPLLFMSGIASLQDDGQEVIYMDTNGSKMEPELSSVEVGPTSWFSCMACRCSTSDGRRLCL